MCHALHEFLKLVFGLLVVWISALVRNRLTLVVLFSASGPVYALPQGFQNELVLEGLTEPVHLTQLPDGRMLVLEKQGRVLLFDPDTPSVPPTIYLTIHDIDVGGERGLTSLVLDPDFEENRHIYIYYTHASSKRNRVSRFTHQGDFADPSSEELLWQDNEDWEKCCHHGGGLGFGPDGKLYLTTGEGFRKIKSPDLKRAGGKIIRINKDGSIPNDNPFADGDGGNLDEVWAFGLRNPFRSYWDPVTGRLFIGDVGGNEPETAREEINLGERGANYGWPICEGICGRANVKDPLHDYPHAGPRFYGGSVTAGFVYWGSSFPAEYSGVFFFADYSLSWIRFLVFRSNGEVESVNDFASEVGAPVFLTQGKEGSLYYVDYQGEVRRIVYTGQGSVPGEVKINASYSIGKAPQIVKFSVDVSADSEESLQYTWWFGDGMVSNLRSPEHVYADNGPYQVHVRVSNGVHSRISEPFTLIIGNPPVVTINQPAPFLLFRSGDEVLVSGSVVGGDKNVGPSEMRWIVEPVGHGGGQLIKFIGKSGSFKIGPKSNGAYTITLTVTDEDYLKASDSRTIYADLVSVEFDVVPRGIPMTLDGERYDLPIVSDFLIGSSLTPSVPETYCRDGKRYRFASWSDGGMPTHEITVPERGNKYTATFEVSDSCSSPPAEGLVLHLEADAGVSEAGARITSWADQSGLGNDLVAQGKPILLPGILNGYPVIDLDGKNDKLERSADLHGLPERNRDRTIFLLAKYRGGGFGGLTYGTGEGPPHTCNQAFGAVVDRVGALAVQGWCDDFSSWEKGVGRGWVIQSVILSSGEVSHYLGGLLIDMVDHNYDTTLSNLVIGAELDSWPYVDMQVAAALAYDRALSEPEHTQIIEYLKEKYLLITDESAGTAKVERSARVRRGSETKLAVVDALGEKIRERAVKPSVRLIKQAENGKVEYNNKKSLFEYRHDGSRSLVDSFSYEVIDDGQCNPIMTVNVHIEVFGSSFDDVQSIFTNRCVICHDGEHSPDLDEGSAYASIVGVPSLGMESLNYIEPEQPEKSYLWHKISGTHIDAGGSGQRMPLAGGYLSEEELNTVRRWIEGGAPEHGEPGEAKPWYRFW